MLLSHPEGFAELRVQHCQRFFGPLSDPVIHSTDVQPVHIDIHQFAPSAERAHWTLVTDGMSDERQPTKAEDTQAIPVRTEMLMYVQQPRDWMFSVLKALAEMPFTDNTVLHWGHTIQNGMPMTQTPSLLTAFLLLPSFCEEEAFGELQLAGDVVDFLWLVPITEAERAFAVRHGSRELVGKFLSAGMPMAVDESRKSVV